MYTLARDFAEGDFAYIEEAVYEFHGVSEGYSLSRQKRQKRQMKAVFIRMDNGRRKSLDLDALAWKTTPVFL